jgi:hypothetical protein
MTDGFSGGCLCGRVTYVTSMPPQLVGHCHCIDCRKSSGSGHCTHVIVHEDAVDIKGEVKFYEHPADSGNIVSRGFCAQCGCPILSKNSGMPGMAAIRASSLDDPNIITPRMVVYASRAPVWDQMDERLPHFPLAPEGGATAVINAALDGSED